MNQQTEIKLRAQVKALEVLVQHLVYVACDRDVEAVKAYARRIGDEYAEASISDLPPEWSDLFADELKGQLGRILDDLIARLQREQGSAS